MRVVRVIRNVVVLGLLLTVLAYWLYSRNIRRAFEEKVGEIRAQGLPVTAEELEKYYYGADAGAKAQGLALVRVFDSYDDSLGTLNEIFYTDRIPPPGGKYSEADMEHARSHLSRNETYMDELHTLLGEDVELRYPMNLADGWQVKFPHLAQARNALRMLSLQSFVAAVDEDKGLVVQSLDDAAAMSDTLRDEPYVISQLVRIACVSIMWTQAQVALNASSLDVDSLSRLQRRVESLNLRGAIVVGAVGDRCMYYESTESMVGLKPVIGWLDPAEYGLEGSRKFVAGELSALNLYLSLSDLSELGEGQPWKRRTLADDYVENTIGGWAPLHFFEPISLPAMARAYSAEDRGLAHLATYRAALAALRYCREQGRRPADLAELVPGYLSEIPVDPLDGRPIRYANTDSGFAVYSLGHDLDDDGGAPPGEDESILDDGDIAFRIFDATAYQAESNSRD